MAKVSYNTQILGLILELDFLLIFFSIVFLAAFIHGGVGFGFPMIATPLIALYTDIQTAIIYTLIPTLLVNIVSIANEGEFFKAIKKFYPLAILAMIGSAIGTYTLIYFSSDIFKIILAMAILIYLFFDLVKIELPWIERNPKSSLLFFGLGSGILGGLTNVMSATLIIYALESKFSKKEIIQSFNICFLFGKLVQIAIFTTSSVFTFQQFSESSLSLIVIAIALFFGIKIKKLINAELFKKIVKMILFSISMMLFVQVY